MRYYALSLFFLFVLLVLNIYNFMSTETWGLMPKSQTDNTKIEDRIADMINEHNADPTAHMADDQSIGIHRINDTVDHPAGSVLADKWTMSEMEFTTTFENLSAFATVGNVEQLWPGVYVETNGASTPHISKLILDGESNLLNFDTGLEFLAQIVAYVEQSDTEKSRFLYGGATGTTNYKGVGFEVVGDVARFFAGKQDSSVVNYLEWPTFELFTTYVIRIHNVPSEGVIRVYINGNLLGELEWPEEFTDALTSEFVAESNVGYGNIFRIRSFYFSQQPS